MTSNLTRTLRAAFLCTTLLAAGSIYFSNFHTAAQKQDAVMGLLRLPAPPPPNPQVSKRARRYGDPFFNKKAPPRDDAPIDDVLDYWSQQQRAIRNPRYTPEMSAKTLERIEREVEDDPSKLPRVLGSLPETDKAAEFVKRIYDREGTSGVFDKDERKEIKEWLIYHSSFFSDELYRRAQRTKDSEEYVTNQEDLLQLARHDFSRAQPLIDRILADSNNRASQVVAKWALYRHALDSGSTSDIERYRNELKKLVEDKALAGPMRDLAMDALVVEKDWPGRDEWYMSLLGDETLTEIPGYTGLTTLINLSPDDKYVAKMLELLKTDNPTVRAAVIRNLGLQLDSKNIEILRALVPWLADPKWAKDVGDTRSSLLRALSSVELPESVPGLIAMLDEKTKQPNYALSNVVANRPASNTRWASNANYGGPPIVEEIEVYRYRPQAIVALAKQADPQAAPALRRVLYEVDGYQRMAAVAALLRCKGFSIPEQLDALESAVKKGAEQERAMQAAVAAANAANTLANAAVKLATNSYSGVYGPNGPMYSREPLTAADINTLLGAVVIQDSEPSDEFAMAVVDRIETLDKRDPELARALRNVVLRWQNSAVDLLLLRDARRDMADIETLLRLLGSRKHLRDKVPEAVSALRTGTPSAVGLAACLLEDIPDYDAILDGDNVTTKQALLACARLIRAPLSVPKVAELAKKGDKQTAEAASLYLESEDSPEARAVVLALHPGEVKILGATTAFFPDGYSGMAGGYLWTLFYSDDPDGPEGYGGPWLGGQDHDLASVGKKLQDEIKKDETLLGVYSFDRNYIRIYKDKAVYSWDEDDSRYRERPLKKDEFDELRSYLDLHRADSLPPFLECPREYCPANELLMIGRGGGRRVYTAGEPAPFFVGLNKYFANLKLGGGVIKYQLSRELPGLELVLTDENLHAETVWKNGADLRVAVSEVQVREKVKEEIERAAEEAEETGLDETEEDEDAPYRYLSPGDRVRYKLATKREFEGYTWRRVEAGRDAGEVAQPAGVEFIPADDDTSIKPTQEQWKARYGTTDLRAGEDGLYKVTRGRASKFKAGKFGTPLVTPNGRWAIAYKFPDAEDEDGGLVRINVASGRTFPVKVEEYMMWAPIANIPGNRVLLELLNDDEHEYTDEADDTVEDDADSGQLMLLDPDTGALSEPKGEFRPLAQQRFRPLQPTAKPGEFWAAIYDTEGNATDVGVYSTVSSSFKNILRVPKIRFNSMSMWVDEPAAKVYFVYRGHLLSLPLKSGK